MLPSFSRGRQLALVLALSAGYVAWHGHGHPAYAQGADGEEEGDGDDDAKGKDEPDEGEDPDDKDQPPVTAGGLFTMVTYPVSELLRPLTMTEKIAQIRLGLGTDLSALGAFGSAGASLEGVYGVTDNFSVLGGFTGAYNFKQFGLYAGFEGSLIYDLLDIRVAANLHRFAIPRFCDTDTMDRPASCDATMHVPDGNYDADDIKFSVDLGFPFRYAIKPEIAIIALQTLMSIDVNETPGNGVKPDLNPSVGIATNPIPALSLVVFAQLRIPDFNTSADVFQVPVTGRVEFSPNRKFDIGLEFTLLNVKPPEPQKAFDNRFLSLFVQTRIGK